MKRQRTEVAPRVIGIMRDVVSPVLGRFDTVVLLCRPALVMTISVCTTEDTSRIVDCVLVA